MQVNLSAEMIKVLRDILVDAPYELDAYQAGNPDYVVSGQDALRLFEDLYEQTNRITGKNT
jgi:hypothetical protein